MADSITHSILVRRPMPMGMIPAMISMLQKLGGLTNVLGVPGIVRDVEYKSQRLGTRVQVRRGKLFTVISVNGVNVYLDRLTGAIDSVGLAPPSARLPASPVLIAGL